METDCQTSFDQYYLFDNADSVVVSFFLLKIMPKNSSSLFETIYIEKDTLII